MVCYMDLPCVGGTQTFPAVSSGLVVPRLLIYLRSVSSSAVVAQGKAALNMPDALIKPSLLRLCTETFT